MQNLTTKEHHEKKNSQSLFTKIDLSHILKAAADPIRLEILKVMQRDSFSVQELANIFTIAQPSMSHHLKILSRAELIDCRREGNSLFYRRSTISSNTANNTKPYKALIHTLFASIDQIPLDQETASRIEQAHQARADASREFFNKNATKFLERQGQIATYGQYATVVEELLEKITLPKFNSAMEIGPGEGELLSHLTSKFNLIYALDNSNEMLKRAEKSISKNKEMLKKVKFILGEPHTAYSNNIKVDLLILNMVLHHLPIPEEFFTTAHDILNANGKLVLIELCEHNQQWVKEMCGDLWLGFKPQDLDHWAQANHFTLEQEIFLGFKNGFQIQMKVYLDNKNKKINQS
ncbi:MAG: metalloregulator ArsR/SmtB family transcription factor [Bdellovibrionota bacterium]